MSPNVAWAVIILSLIMPFGGGFWWMRRNKESAEVTKCLLVFIGWLPAACCWVWLQPIVKPDPPTIPYRSSDIEVAMMASAQPVPTGNVTTVTTVELTSATEIAIRVLGRDEVVVLFGVTVPPEMQEKAMAAMRELLAIGPLAVSEMGRGADARLIVNAYVIADVEERDDYAHYLNRGLVAGGYARVTSNDHDLLFEQELAQKEHRGIWR